MTVFTEGRHAAEFILSEAAGNRSRDAAVVLATTVLVAGEVVMDNGAGKLIAHDGLLNTAGDVITPVAGIVIYPVANAATDTDVALLSRDAEVNQKLVTYPTESTAGGEQAGVNASLAALGIIARD